MRRSHDLLERWQQLSLTQIASDTYDNEDGVGDFTHTFSLQQNRAYEILDI